MTASLRPRVLLSVQRALLGAITTEIRAVDVTWNDIEIVIWFTLGSDCDYDFDEIANEIEGEVEGDFLPDFKVRSEIRLISEEDNIPIVETKNGGVARVFARRE